MMRVFLILLAILISVFLFLQLENKKTADRLPAFLLNDTIAENHHTNIEIKVNSVHKPSAFELDKIKKDYSNLWAHLNHLYSTNEVEAGKEYFTEELYKTLCGNYENKMETVISRIDSDHQLHISNWSSDGLICTVIDSNIVLTYKYPDNTSRTTTADIALVLLYQGDHWRLDAMRILNENETLIN